MPQCKGIQCVETGTAYCDNPLFFSLILRSLQQLVTFSSENKNTNATNHLKSRLTTYNMRAASYTEQVEENHG